ncbi:hypothetical protein CALCODRAFT_502531 [Calocera cornea HHB12733]|uniref:NTF2-like protein n=1 Tax=Calocera cornea HHB12733 TaxID=1353952 RepID=A0A165D7H8_9BASI|nr:hypothetical protein CALCODRAFT_502531 [Calocera cornea HHB12733]
MADAKWAAYREPPAVTGYEPKKMRKFPRGGEGGSTTGVGSSRRGGSSTLHGEDENMDGRSGSRRYDVLSRRGRPAGSSGRPPPPEDLQHVELLKDFVQRKYNPAAQFLAFDDIFGDQILRANGLTKWTATTSTQDKLADALWKAAGSLDPPVQTISAARNSMTRLQVQRIPQYLPGLRNLSLRENDIDNLGEISNFFTRRRTGGLRHLQEIWLLGNPIRARSERFDDMDQYYYDVANAMRTLKVVDGQPIPGASWDIEESTQVGRGTWPEGQSYPVSFPVTMAPSSVDEHLREMIGGILSQFFAFYDNDRKSLIHAYHPEATFSVSALPHTPPRRTLNNDYKPEKGTLATGGLLKNLSTTPGAGMYRNLRNIAGAHARERSLHVGHRSILEIFETLPPSKHPLQDGSKFVFDATLLPDMGSGDMLEVTVQGEFLEPIMNVVFSFARAFVLVTAGAGSTAEQIGMNVLVMSDILELRRPTPSTVWTPGPMVSQGDAWAQSNWSRQSNQPVVARGQGAQARAPPPVAAQPAPTPYQPAPAPNSFQAPAFQQPPAPNPFGQPQQPTQTFAAPQPQQPPMQPPQPTAAPPVQPPPAPAPTPAGPAEIPPEMQSLTPAQRELAMAFSGVTGLVIPATLSVLGENGWDGDAAFAKLLEVKSAIPGEWWIGGAPKI